MGVKLIGSLLILYVISCSLTAAKRTRKGGRDAYSGGWASNYCEDQDEFNECKVSP